jgi:hypothetical protein
MRNNASIPNATFQLLFCAFLPAKILRGLFTRFGPRRRRPHTISQSELLMALVYHVLAGAGTLAQHVRDLTGKTLSDSALAQRRQSWSWTLFEMILEAALGPKACPRAHPEAFYHGLRLCGVDGTNFSVANTPQNKRQMRKTRTRRGLAAFAKIGVVVLVELGLRNPLAAAIGCKRESEMVLARQVLDHLPEKSLLISDRYYGVPVLLLDFQEWFDRKSQREFLVRVKSNLKRRLLEHNPDGSALVEIRAGKRKRLVREITGRVRRGRGSWSTVRLWTSLLDWRKHPAHELLELYARRWEQETFYRELKVDMRTRPLVQSHTAVTAAQEIAALLLAYALLVDERSKAAKMGEVPVLRISFLKTLEAMRGLWRTLEVTADLLDARGVRLVVLRTLRSLAEKAIPERRERACQRGLRQPVSSWSRIIKNRSIKAAPEYDLISITA